MPRLVWFILAGVLFFVATITLVGAVIRGLIGEVAKYPIGNIITTFLFIFLLDYGAYWSWSRARASDKQIEKEA